jgi:hypothetical protein
VSSTTSSTDAFRREASETRASGCALNYSGHRDIAAGTRPIVRGPARSHQRSLRVWLVLHADICARGAQAVAVQIRGSRTANRGSNLPPDHGNRKWLPTSC